MNRREFLGCACAASGAALLLPPLRLWADTAVVSPYTATVWIARADGGRYKFEHLPITVSGDLWRLPNCSIEATEPVTITGIEAQVHLGFPDAKVVTFPLPGAPHRLRPGDTATFTNIRFTVV